ncbi:unnamed protein product [Cylindrotheca closterium]|uniref:Fe2OG dioxygenase domain-containing protein n=1 Tax=Cylindrotheca closterium TaxID=2856 RepID=A0AAD2FPD9_9STRA|nr:unnamed protein product [Cylindrotheca closterium]
MQNSIDPGYANYQGLLLASWFGPLILCLGIIPTADAFVSSPASSTLHLLSSASSATIDNFPLREQPFRRRTQYCTLRQSVADDNEDVSNDAVLKEEQAVSSELPSQASGFWTGPESARPLHDSTYTQILSTVLPELGAQLRQEYDDHFADPRQPDAARFAWDPWFVSVGDTGNRLEAAEEKEEEGEGVDSDEEKLLLVPGEVDAGKKQTQYSLKRIQTSQFFSSDSYDLLVDELMVVGRSVGLHAITPPWTSMYTDGDQQNWHTDAPHGPLAFVLSVCADEGDFEGGETMLLQPQILDFWKGFDSSNGLECGNIVRHIPPFPLGRCIAFDPRVPHGVNRVTGNGPNPKRARVVVHGWFNEPQTTWFGAWNDNVDDSSDAEDEEIPEDAAILLDQVLQPLVSTLASGEIGRVVGYLAVRMDVTPEGSVEDVSAVCDTLRADPEDFRGVIGYDEADRPVMEDAVADVRLSIFETLKDLYFGPAKGERAVIVPFDFE